MAKHQNLRLRNSGAMGPDYSSVKFNNVVGSVEYNERGKYIPFEGDASNGIAIRLSEGDNDCIISRPQIESLRDFLNDFLDAHPVRSNPDDVLMIERF